MALPPSMRAESTPLTRLPTEQTVQVRALLVGAAGLGGVARAALGLKDLAAAAVAMVAVTAVAVVVYNEVVVISLQVVGRGGTVVEVGGWRRNISEGRVPNCRTDLGALRRVASTSSVVATLLALLLAHGAEVGNE